MGVYYYGRLTKNLRVVPLIGQITHKFIDKTEQGFYTGYVKAAEFKNGLNYALRPPPVFMPEF